MNTKRTNKVLTMSVLCVAVLALAVGFAAFSNTLTISSSANVTPNANTFNVDFSTSSTSVVDDDVIATVSPSTLTATPGKIDNSAAPTLTGLSVDFTEPGQSATYNLYAYNAGEFIAYLNSVTLKGNKSCTPGEGTSVELTGKACEDIILSVKVGEDSYTETTTGITGKSIGVGKSTEVEVTITYLNNGNRADGPFSVEFNDVSLYYSTVTGQDEEYEGESGTLYTGLIYRNSEESLYIGKPISGKMWCMDVAGMINSCDEGVSYNSEEECETYIEEAANSAETEEEKELIATSTCEIRTISYEYETNVSNISQNYYLKHEVINNVVTASYACITYTENGVRKDTCLRGGDTSYYASNQGIMRGVESYFNTLASNSGSTGYGYCRFYYDSPSYCSSDPLNLKATPDGDVHASGDGLTCSVNYSGRSYCH